ncbi:CrcB family protein [Opitutales bacterium]|jgi:CrcB protein|nr:CrcB family protein [Opitutales bacterium]
MDWKFLLLVASGGAIGSIFRAIILVLCRSWMPWQTVLTNVLGAFLVGILLRYWEQNSEPYFFRAFWMIGLCGGFTTFSTFGLDAYSFLKSGLWLNMFVYVTISFVGTLFGIFLGFKLCSVFSP